MRFGKWSVGILLAIITNNTAKIQLKILGRTFRLTSGAIVNAKSLRYAGSCLLALTMVSEVSRNVRKVFLGVLFVMQ